MSKNFLCFSLQALHQVLQPILEPDFQEHSYGFRPKRNAHGAVTESLKKVIKTEVSNWFLGLNCFKSLYMIINRSNDFNRLQKGVFKVPNSVL